jgi:arylsulfatase A-like enzyme
MLSLVTVAHPAADGEGMGGRHVLLISIDGMHAVDFENCAANGTCPHLAALKQHGVNYTRTSTSKPSDSFPGLMSLVTGGSPKTVGAFYDVAYDRVLAPPAADTGNGNFAGPCNAGQPNGTTTEYEEGVEMDQTKLNGGFAGYSTIDGGVKSIVEARLVRDPFNGCAAVYPWNFIRTNTIYGVIHANGGFTAWSDKHAVYAAVSGPTGTKNPSNVDDYYSPEVNSTVIPLPMVHPAGSFFTTPAFDCGTPDTTGDYTTSFNNIQCYDQLKVNAVLNWINGKTHLGGNNNGIVPNIFGMNFQAVSVGQKLISKGVKGGYEDNIGTPTAPMLNEIKFVDAAIGQMVDALQAKGLLNSTTIIVTAKHGQSPIDTHRYQGIGHDNSGGSGIATDPATLVAAYLPAGSPENPNTGCKSLTPPLVPPFNQPGFLTQPGNMLCPIGPTEDDIAQLWLTDTSFTKAAVNVLEIPANAANNTGASIGEIFSEASLETMFNKAGIPTKFGGKGGDSRTPDIIVQPNIGVIYSGSSKKQAEHGGFAFDDTNVMLLVSNPSLQSKTLTTFVETAQVAPTILKLLGLDPNALDAVQVEGTPVLPGLGFGNDNQNENEQ